jgi:hypothetical protein
MWIMEVRSPGLPGLFAGIKMEYRIRFGGILVMDGTLASTEHLTFQRSSIAMFSLFVVCKLGPLLLARRSRKMILLWIIAIFL